MENDENIQDGQGEKYTELTKRNKVFALAYVKTRDKYEAYRIARYEAIERDAQAVVISRMLKNPAMQEYIKELEDEQAIADNLTNDMIIANLVDIGFDKNKKDSDRNRALEILAKCRGMMKDVITHEGEQDELSQERLERGRQLAKEAAERERLRLIKMSQGGD